MTPPRISRYGKMSSSQGNIGSIIHKPEASEKPARQMSELLRGRGGELDEDAMDELEAACEAPMTSLERAARAAETIILNETRYLERADGQIEKVTSEPGDDYQVIEIVKGAKSVEEAMAKDVLRAVLTAIREPDWVLSNAGQERGAKMSEDFHSSSYISDEIWKAMIDAALEEEGPAE